MKIHKGRWFYPLLVALAASIVLFAATRADAASLTLCNVCTGFTVSKRGDDVLIRCPGMKDPWLTFAHCLKPVVVRANGNVTVTCR